MYWTGILIGIASFAIIGLFHPIVIHCEYHYTARIWPVFLLVGIAFLVASVFIHKVIPSSVLGLIGFASLWSIGELKEQEERVKKGWFPKNPKRENSQFDQ